MRQDNNEKRQRKNNKRNGNRTPPPKKIKMLGENETYKYLQILEADNNRQAEMKNQKKKKKKRISQENGKTNRNQTT